MTAPHQKIGASLPTTGIDNSQGINIDIFLAIWTFHFKKNIRPVTYNMSENNRDEEDKKKITNLVKDTCSAAIQSPPTPPKKEMCTHSGM